MGVKLLFVLLAGFVCLHGTQCQEPCLLPLMDYTKTPIFRPFIYKADGTFYPTRNNVVKIPSGQDFIVSCENNFFKSHQGIHNMTIKCDDDSLIKEGAKTEFKDLSCDIRVMEEVKHSVDECPEANGGSYYQYYNGKQGLFTVLAEACFDFTKEQNQFIRFFLPFGSEIQHDEKISAFSDVAHKISTLTAYRADRVEDILKNLLTEDFMMADQTIIAVKLLPKKFFNEQLQDVERFSTNYVGLWKTVAKGNWQNLLDDIKDYSQDRKQSLEIILGTHGTLKLSRPDGIETKMYLKDNKVPIPEYIWAVVHDKSKKQAVALITVNNPFSGLEEIKKEMFCQNKCDEITWLKRLLKNNNYDRPIHGYTFCCALGDFKLYQFLESTRLLKN